MAATSLLNTTLKGQELRVPEVEETSNHLISEAEKMVKSIDKNGLKKGAWSEEEDNKLRAYVERYGHWNWRQLPKFAGLARCGKSCRLRWVNYLKPGVKRGNFSPREDELILKLHKEYGNKWSVIASKFPGRTDNDIKNHWNTHLRRPMKQDCKTSKSTEKTSKRSNHMDDSDHNEESSSMTTSDSIQRIDDQMGTNIYNRFSAGDRAYSEVSSLSCDSTLFDGVQDCAAEDITDSLESIMKRFDDESFWNELLASGSSYNNNFHQQQFPASLAEEIMRPFTPHLGEINVDWLHELMQ